MQGVVGVSELMVHHRPRMSVYRAGSTEALPCSRGAQVRSPTAAVCSRDVASMVLWALPDPSRPALAQTLGQALCMLGWGLAVTFP